MQYRKHEAQARRHHSEHGNAQEGFPGATTRRWADTGPHRTAVGTCSFLENMHEESQSLAVFGRKEKTQCFPEGLRLVSPIFYPLRYAIFPTRYRENGHFEVLPLRVAIFPVSRGKNRILQGVENRGSLITVPLALGVS